MSSTEVVRSLLRSSTTQEKQTGLLLHTTQRFNYRWNHNSIPRHKVYNEQTSPRLSSDLTRLEICLPSHTATSGFSAIYRSPVRWAELCVDDALLRPFHRTKDFPTSYGRVHCSSQVKDVHCSLSRRHPSRIDHEYGRRDGLNPSRSCSRPRICNQQHQVNSETFPQSPPPWIFNQLRLMAPEPRGKGPGTPIAHSSSHQQTRSTGTNLGKARRKTDVLCNSRSTAQAPLLVGNDSALSRSLFSSSASSSDRTSLSVGKNFSNIEAPRRGPPISPISISKTPLPWTPPIAALDIRRFTGRLGFIQSHVREAIPRHMDSRGERTPHQCTRDPRATQRISTSKSIWHQNSSLDRQQHRNVVPEETRRTQCPPFILTRPGAPFISKNEKLRTDVGRKDPIRAEQARRRREQAETLLSAVEQSSILSALRRAILPTTFKSYLNDFISFLTFADFNFDNLKNLVIGNPVYIRETGLILSDTNLLANFIESLADSSRPIEATWCALKFTMALLFDVQLERKGRLELMLKSSKKSQKLSVPRFRTGITQADLLTIASFSDNGYEARRDITMMALAARFLLRPSEIVEIRLKNVYRDEEGYKIWIKRKKCQTYHGWVLYALKKSPDELVETVSLLDSFISDLSGHEEFLFQKRSSGQAFTVSEFSSAVKIRARQAGLADRSGHSLRIGGATWLAHRGWSDTEIMSLGNWNSNAYLRYVRLGRSCTTAL